MLSLLLERLLDRMLETNDVIELAGVIEAALEAVLPCVVETKELRVDFSLDKAVLEWLLDDGTLEEDDVAGWLIEELLGTTVDWLLEAIVDLMLLEEDDVAGWLLLEGTVDWLLEVTVDLMLVLEGLLLVTALVWLLETTVDLMLLLVTPLVWLLEVAVDLMLLEALLKELLEGTVE